MERWANNSFDFFLCFGAEGGKFVFRTLLRFSLFAVVVACLGLGAGLLSAQAPAATPAATATGASIHGSIVDPAGAIIPGARITLTNALGVAVAHTTADAAGHYEFANLPVGSYIVQAAVDGFAPFTSPTLQLADGQTKRVRITLAIQTEQQSVVVTDDQGPTVSIDADSNASSVVLKDKDLDALSDDPDELSNELTALAGPSAGPNGGQIYIDGFTGGTLPPKSAIREIRINQNPFSAEFDRIGYGRIEILTKPGTDKFHARGFVQGNDKSFNTGNPFTKNIPDYHSVQYNGNVSGSLSKNASYFITIEGRNTQDANIYTAYVPSFDSTKGQYSYNYDTNGNPLNPTTGGVFAPATRFEFSPRLDLQLGAKNTLTMRFQYERSSSSGSIGTTALPTTATGITSSEYSFQASNSTIITDHLVNEMRLQLRRSISTTTPVSNAPSISVTSYLSAGGSGGNASSHSDHMELQDMFTLSAGAHAIKFGGWLRDNRASESTNSGYNGSYSFKTPQDYVNTLNGAKAIRTLSFTSGQQDFKVKTYRANVFDAAAFFQDDWKVNRFLTLSGGVRFESQNHINDHVDFAPRVAFAYALDGHKDKKQAKTVLRGGYGFFYDRFGINMGLTTNNGSASSLLSTTINNPICFNADSLSNIGSTPQQIIQACTGTGSSKGTAISQIQSLDPNYHSPYDEQLGISVERQLSKAATLSTTYVHTFGVHQTATRNANAYEAGSYQYGSTTLTGTRPNPSQGIVNEIYPEAVFKQNQLIVNSNARFSPTFNLSGFYVFSDAKGNSGTASNSWNLNQDYGRTSFNRRHMVFLMGGYTAPFGIALSPFLVAQSGRSYNIVTNNDLTGDTYYNNRPAYANAASCKAGASNGRYVSTSLGCFDVTPDPGAKLIPINMGKAPSAVAFNLRVSRSFGFGPKTGGAAGPNQGGRPQGSLMGGGPGGGPGGGGHGGGGRGGMGMASTGHKYSLNLSAQALNLFNNVDYGSPSGTLVPTYNSTTQTYGPGNRFGASTKLAGGMFASPSNSAVRRIFFQAAFNF